jgi:hypothetical protein
MVHWNVPLPSKRIYRKTRPVDRNSLQMKEYLVFLGMRALARSDMTRVDIITDLFAERRGRHV